MLVVSIVWGKLRAYASQEVILDVELDIAVPFDCVEDLHLVSVLFN